MIGRTHKLERVATGAQSNLSVRDNRPPFIPFDSLRHLTWICVADEAVDSP